VEFLHLANMEILANFLCKFANGKITNAIGRKLIHASVKYSGSLFMLRGIDQNGFIYAFAKNSTSNEFTRLFTIMLKLYFDEIFQEVSNAFHKFAKTIYDKKITLCFELVVPKVLGQHGGTPNMPHFVLTAITGPGDSPLQRNIWGIDQMLQFATIYKLPIVGGAIFTNEPIMDSIEYGKYHWDSQQAESFLFDSSEINWAVNPEYPLSHTMQQGPVFEGFVIKEYLVQDIDSTMETIKRAAAKYNKVMAPVANIAKCYFQSLNDRISNSNPQDIADWYAEVVMTPYKELEVVKMTEELNSKMIAICSVSSPMFANLFIRYGAQVKIKCYEAGKTTLVQVQVKNDDIFGAISLSNPGDTLFRGLVLKIKDECDSNCNDNSNCDSNCNDSNSQCDSECDSQCDHISQLSCLPEMCNIIKIKCFLYIARVFPIRNVIRNITGDSKTDARLINNFLKNWSIPEQYHSATKEYLHALYDIFSKIDVNCRGERYLEIVEKFAASNHPHNAAFNALFGYTNDSSTHPLTKLSNLFVLDLGNIGASNFESSMNIAAAVFVTNVPSLGNGPFDDKFIVIFTKPDENEKKINGIKGGLAKKGAHCILVNPTSGKEIMDAMQSSGIDTASAATPATASAAKPLTIIFFLGMTIASGKSTITKHLCQNLENCTSVLKEGIKSNLYEKRVLDLALQEDVHFLVMEKNHPDKDGLDSTLSIIEKITRPVKMVAIVPEQLEELSILKKRIQDRRGKTSIEIGGSAFIPGTPGLMDGEWEKLFVERFYNQSKKYLSYFQRFSNAILLDVKQIPSYNAKMITDKILSNTVETDTSNFN